MGSYVTGLAIAIFVVTGLLNLLSYAQEDSTAAIESRIARMDQATLLKTALDEKSDNRVESILRLAETPGNLEESVPVLAKLTMDPNELVRSASAIVLQKIGPDGAPHVRKMMESTDQHELSYACSALKEMGGAKIYLPQLKKWLAGTEKLDRRRALFALQGPDADAVELIDLLVDALRDSDFNHQCMACRVLENLGADAMPAEDEVLRLLKTGNPSARSWAAIVLGAIGPTDKTDPAEILGNNLEAFLQVDKQRTLLGLAHLGPEASRVQDLVRNSMNDHTKRVMPHAAYALWKITGKPEESLAVLSEMLDDPDYADDAVEFIGKMQTAGAPLVDKLVARLSSEEETIRESAVVALGNIGPPAASATDAIKKRLSDPDALIRYAARESLKQIAGDKGEK